MGSDPAPHAERLYCQVAPSLCQRTGTPCCCSFGLAAAAGDLATAIGITGRPDGTATTAARVCLNAWMNERGGAGNFEGDAILARLRQVIERFGESRFTRWESAAAKIDEHGPRTIDRLGFRKTLEHGTGNTVLTTNTYYLLPEAWRSEIFKGMNINAVNKELLRRGVLEPGADGKASTAVRLPGLGLQRCYVVVAVPEQGEREARRLSRGLIHEVAPAYSGLASQAHTTKNLTLGLTMNELKQQQSALISERETLEQFSRLGGSLAQCAQQLGLSAL